MFTSFRCSPVCPLYRALLRFATTRFRYRRITGASKKLKADCRRATFTKLTQKKKKKKKKKKKEKRKRKRWDHTL